MNLKEKLILAKKNKLSVKDIHDLIRLMNSTKIAQKKCDIAVALSFIRNQPEIIESIVRIIPYWQRSIYSGSAITTYSRLIVNYFNLYKFKSLLHSSDPTVRKFISRAFCFTILTEGVDCSQAVSVYKKARSILEKYLIHESDKKNKKFIQKFLQQYH